MIGSSPPMVRDTRHDSVHIFGAICPARGTGAAIVMPAVNTEAMNEHLAEISWQAAPRALSRAVNVRRRGRADNSDGASLRLVLCGERGHGREDRSAPAGLNSREEDGRRA